VINHLICLRSLFHPFPQNSLILLRRTVQLSTPVLDPLPLSHDLSRVQVFQILFVADEVARDELICGKYDEADVVAVLVVAKLEVVVRVAFPA
jgi:hypothetical protein